MEHTVSNARCRSGSGGGQLLVLQPSASIDAAANSEAFIVTSCRHRATPRTSPRPTSPRRFSFTVHERTLATAFSMLVLALLASVIPVSLLAQDGNNTSTGDGGDEIGSAQLASFVPTYMSASGDGVAQVKTTLDPPFLSGETSYSLTLPATATAISFTALAEDPDDSRIMAQWDGGDEIRLTSGKPSPNFTINTDASFQQLVVTVIRPPFLAVVYSVDVLRSDLASANARLLSLSLAPPPDAQQFSSDDEAFEAMVESMMPEMFSSATTLYVIQLNPGFTALRILPDVDAGARVMFSAHNLSLEEYLNDAPSLTPPPDPSAALVPRFDYTPLIIPPLDGVSKVVLDITAEDGEHRRVYTFYIARADVELPDRTFDLTSSSGIDIGGSNTSSTAGTPAFSSTAGNNGDGGGVTDDGTNSSNALNPPSAFDLLISLATLLICTRWHFV